MSRNLALGEGVFGVTALAGWQVYELPTVTIATIGTVTTGGPTYQVSWTYNQPQSHPQGQYRVRVYLTAGDVLQYDSGTLTGADLNHTVDIVAEGISLSSALYMKVDLTPGGGTGYGSPGTDTENAQFNWGDPQLTITAPIGIVTSTPVTASWSLVDAGKTQSAYRVRLEQQSSGVELYDSGWVTSTDTSYEIPFQLQDGSHYSLFAQVKNNHGVLSS